MTEVRPNNETLTRHPLRIVLVHGNMTPGEPSWFAKTKIDLEGLENVQVEAQLMPDNLLAREDVWIKKLEKICDENTVIVGHSSGAIAAMRYAEQHKIAGLVLISAYETSLEDNKLPQPLRLIVNQLEKLSGYFNRPWDYAAIRRNTKHIIQIGPKDDEIIPRSETEAVRAMLPGVEFIEVGKHIHRGHNVATGTKGDYMPELELALQKAIQENKFGLK